MGIVRPEGLVELMDTDLSTVSAAADKVLLIEDDPILPWAPLADHSGIGLQDLAKRIGQRLHAEADFANGDRIVTMISVLMKLRYDAMTTAELIRSIPDVEEYPRFKMFLDQGRTEGRMREARSHLIRQGNKKFGPPSPVQEAAINALTDLPRLEALSEKLLDVATWDDLLNGN